MKRFSKFGSFLLAVSVALSYGGVPVFAQSGVSGSGSAGTSSEVKYDNFGSGKNGVKAGAGLNAQLRVNLPQVKERAASNGESLGQKIRKEVKLDIANGEKPKKEAVRVLVREKMIDRFSLLINDFSQIVGRIKSRAEKMKQKGLDVSAEEALVSKAEADIVAAKNFLAEIKVKVEANASFQDIKRSVVSMKDSLKETHKYLIEAVLGLKTKL